MAVTWVRDGSVAVVTLNNPPVNAIGLDVRTGLMEALDWVEREQGLSRVILTGAGRTFAAGGDAREFDGPPVAPHLPDVVNRIEDCTVPWIAALNGAALGGGAELALACRYRIAAPAVQIGLPEVSLGVVPGAGGTQRLPRLIGLRRALEMISLGRPVTAEAAEAMGLIDGIAEDPVELVRHLDQGTIELGEQIGALDGPGFDASVVEEAKKTVATKLAGQAAPQRAIELVARACTAPLTEGMVEEREAFLTLRSQDQAKALRHIFFAERGAKAPAELTAEPAPLDHIAVVGGGMMGAGISYGLLSAGLAVSLLETDAEGVERATGTVKGLIDAGLKRGRVTKANAADMQSRLSVTHDPGQLSKASLAIEAAFESMEVKHEVFHTLEAHLRPDAILATNTSYLDLDEIAGSVADPSRVLGLHFFAPAHIMRLLEIVEGAATSPRAMATGWALAKRLRKVAVRSGVCDGFIGNRILARYREAADTVFMDGSTPWEVDEAMVEFGYAMGPYEAQDLSGLDIAHANRRRQDATRDPNRRYIPIADRMVELGKLGKKTGAGWYRYPGGGGKVEDPIVADLANEESHFAGRERTDYEPDEIRHRLLLAMINEAADILGEGIAASASDIDLVTVFGYGFPRWRGGLMHYADSLGPAEIVKGLEALCKEDPLVWAPSKVLTDCVARGLSLADWRP